MTASIRQFRMILLLLWLFPAGPLAAQTTSAMFGPANYSAVLVIHTGTGTMRMAVAKRGMEWRQSMPMSHGAYELMLFDEKKIFVVMPQAHMCMSHVFPSAPPAGVLAEAEKHHAKVTDLGPATVQVGGKTYACEHRRVDYTDKSGQRYLMDVYTANALENFPVKMTMAARGKTTTVEYEDIRLSPPPAAPLFIPPAHCIATPSTMTLHGEKTIRVPHR